MEISERVQNGRDLRVFRSAMEAAMRIYDATKVFPKEEQFSLTDQVRRSSRSVCANIGEAWRKRCYPAHFCSKLTDAEAEAEETCVWLLFAEQCGYLEAPLAHELQSQYDRIIAQLVTMSSSPERWKV